ncbi:MAG TPA: YDG domain-containing protein [Bacteroidales bacterium]|nr:YDG domain-containing protein [Bacteroidales bacterium]
MIGYVPTLFPAVLDNAPKELTVENAVVTTKVYDGTNSATITGATLSSGIVGNDNVVLDYEETGTFDNANAGTGKTVTTAMNLGGSHSGNYTLKQPTLTGTITPKELTYVLTAETKYYDGTTNAVVSTIGVNGLLYGDIVTVNATNGNFDTKNVGKNKTVTADISLSGSSAGNYTCKPTATAFADIYNIPLTAQFSISPSLASYKGGTKVLLTLTYPKPLDVIEGSPNIGINGIGLSISEPFVTTDRITWTYEWTVPTSGSGEVKFTAAVPDIGKNFSQLTTGQTVLVVDNSVTGIQTVSADANVKVYPTVNQGEFKVHMSNPETGVVNVKVVSMSGSMVEEFKFNKSLPEETFIVNMGASTAGVYMVEVSLDGYRNVKKMVVK